MVKNKTMRAQCRKGRMILKNTDDASLYIKVRDVALVFLVIVGKLVETRNIERAMKTGRWQSHVNLCPKKITTENTHAY